MIRILSLLLVACGLFAVETSTTINVSYGQSAVAPATSAVLGHTTQIAIGTAEVIVAFTNAPVRWVVVQVQPSVDMTLRWTQGSTTDAIPVVANRTYGFLVQGTAMNIYPIAGGAGTLYVTPLTYVVPQ